jgi:Undecaprenyl-phosphate glucose phosphotransferase
MRNDEQSKRSVGYSWNRASGIARNRASRASQAFQADGQSPFTLHWSMPPLLGKRTEFANENEAEMRRRKGSAILNTQAYGIEPLLCDAALIVLLSIVSGVTYHLVVFGWPGDVSVFAGAGVLVSLLFCGILRIKALRLPFGSSVAYERARDGLSSWLAAFALFLFIAFTMKMGSSLSRGAILSFFLIGACGIVISRVKIPILLKKLLGRHALDGNDVTIVGPSGNSVCANLYRDLQAIVDVDHEPHFVGYEANCPEDQWPAEVARILYKTQKRAHEAGPGEILVVAAGVNPARLNDVLDNLAWLPRPICIVPDDWTASVLRQKRAVVGKHIALEFQRGPLNAMQRATKRAIDLALATTVALIVFAPLFCLLAIAIKCDSPGPVMFRQSRTGYRGRVFRIFKFRTMTVQEDGPAIKQAQKHDPRVTRVGRFLRRFSLDELPQILNVIAGDMSLVGPRPHAVGHDRDYESQIPSYTLRQHIQPGITGWAQINGLRGETSTPGAMHKRVEHDIWYLRNCSIALDVKILARTVFEIMRARNAY